MAEPSAHNPGGYVGARVARLEDDRLLRGLGRYLDDVDLPGMLHAAFVRSLYANAAIRSIDVAAARSAPGVHLVLTGHDLGDLAGPLPAFVPDPGMRNPRTQLPLAVDRVRYVGETIAVVVADDRYLAEDAAQLVAVDYEPLPAVVELDPASAGSGLVHDDVADNVAGEFHDRAGDPDAVFAAAPMTERLRLTLERTCASPIETRGVVADWDRRERRLRIWDSTQAPVAIKHGLARLLKLSEEQVDVVAPDIGGGFGAKIMVFYPEELLIPLLALRLGRAVKWSEDRWEYFVSANQERSQIHDAEIAFDADGTILAVRTSFLHDSGAYTPYGSDVAFNTATHVLGQYRIPAFDVRCTVRFTNKPAVSPYRGAGRPHAVFVMERLIRAMARRLGRDPNDIRRQNLIPADAFPYDTGLHIKAPCRYDSGNYQAGFEMAIGLLEPDAFRAEQAAARQEGRYLGMGLATYVEATAPGAQEGCAARLEPSGKLVLSLGISSQGQGHQTTFAQIAADELGCRVEDVLVREGDTSRFSEGIGTFGSRALLQAGNAVAVAARALRRQVVDFAAQLFECSPDDVVIEDGAVHVAGAPSPRLSLAAVAHLANPYGYPGEWARDEDQVALAAASERAAANPRTSPSFEARGTFAPSQMAFGSGVHAATVEVDVATGKVSIRKYVVVHDCGVIVNPTIVEGQVLGGLAQGIGGALLERLDFDPDGQPLTTSFMDFRLPTIEDMPPVRLGHVETPSPLNPLGVKGTGEAGVIPVSAVIAEAIEDALEPFGVRIDAMPLFPDQIVGLVEAARVPS